jgi:hypothetical protein
MALRQLSVEEGRDADDASDDEGGESGCGSGAGVQQRCHKIAKTTLGLSGEPRRHALPILDTGPRMIYRRWSTSGRGARAGSSLRDSPGQRSTDNADTLDRHPLPES